MASGESGLRSEVRNVKVGEFPSSDGEIRDGREQAALRLRASQVHIRGSQVLWGRLSLGRGRGGEGT